MQVWKESRRDASARRRGKLQLRPSPEPASNTAIPVNLFKNIPNQNYCFHSLQAGLDFLTIELLRTKLCGGSYPGCWSFVPEFEFAALFIWYWCLLLTSLPRNKEKNLRFICLLFPFLVFFGLHFMKVSYK